jgi:hypothetical protein
MAETNLAAPAQTSETSASEPSLLLDLPAGMYPTQRHLSPCSCLTELRNRIYEHCLQYGEEYNERVLPVLDDDAIAPPAVFLQPKSMQINILGRLENCVRRRYGRPQMHRKPQLTTRHFVSLTQVNSQTRKEFLAWYLKDMNINIWIYDITLYINTFFPRSKPAVIVAAYAAIINIHIADRIAKWVDLRPLLELLSRAPKITVKFKTLFGHNDLVAELNRTVRHMRRACFPDASSIALLPRPRTIRIHFPFIRGTFAPAPKAKVCIVYKLHDRRQWMEWTALNGHFTSWPAEIPGPDRALFTVREYMGEKWGTVLATMGLAWDSAAVDYVCSLEA